MALELVTFADEDVISAPGRDYEVVRDESMSSLHEIEDAFGLPDSTLSLEQETNTEHVSQ